MPLDNARSACCTIVVGSVTVLTQGADKGQDIFPAPLAAGGPCGRLLGKPGSGGSSLLGLLLPVTDPFFQLRLEPSQFGSRIPPPELPRRNRAGHQPGKSRQDAHLSQASGRSPRGARSS